MLFVVILFALLILNLIIAILSNTYNIFDPKSNGLFLSKILASRDELEYDDAYGAYLASLTPLNFVTFPFVPFAIFMPASPRLNNFVMKLQYILLMTIMFILFISVSILIMPFAFLKSLYLKFYLIFESQTFSQYFIRSLNFGIFVVFGVGLMTLTFLADCIYFWINNFRQEGLKKIVIDRAPSTITMSWIKKL